MQAIELGTIAVDVQRARAYVLAHGSLREQARLAGIFGASGPDRALVKEIEVLQNADGGFPPLGEPDGPSSMDATCAMLAQLKDMPPLAGSPMASRAISCLRRSQQPDGSWREGSAVDKRAQSSEYVTAFSTYTLVTMDREHLDPVMRGLSWLRQAMVSEGEPQARTLALFWATWVKLHGPRTVEGDSAFAQLSQRNLTAPELALWLSCALEVGAGGPYLVTLAQGLVYLASMQGPEGAWLAVDATLSALRVLRGYNVV
jgi:hypothetical protein